VSASPSTPPAPPVTRFLAGANVLLFIVMVVGGADAMQPSIEVLLVMGANFGPLTAYGEWWRLLTCAFVHGGLLHLAVNCWVLWRFGAVLERAFGARAYLFIFLSAAVGASLCSLMWRPDGVSVGASGGLLGVCGAMLAWVHAHRRLLEPAAVRHSYRGMLQIALLNGLLAFVIPNIDHAAHLGGFVTGFVVARLCLRPPALPFRPPPVPRGLLLGTLAALALLCVGARLRVSAAPEARARLHAFAGLAAHERGDFEAARSSLEQALELAPADVELWIQLAAAHERIGAFERSLQALDRAVQHGPQEPLVWYDRALVGLKLDRLEQAALDLERALELEPDFLAARELELDVLELQGRWEVLEQRADAVLEDDRGNLAAFLARSHARAEQGDVAGAWEDHAAAARLAPDSRQVDQLARALRVRLGPPPGADSERADG